MRKRAYLLKDHDSEHALGVVAKSAREAKKLGYHELHSWGDCLYTDVTVNWIRVNVDHLPYGIIQEDIEALRLGIYGWIEGYCPRCNDHGHVSCEDGYVGCLTCIDNYNEAVEKGIVKKGSLIDNRGNLI